MVFIVQTFDGSRGKSLNTKPKTSTNRQVRKPMSTDYYTIFLYQPVVGEKSTSAIIYIQKLVFVVSPKNLFTS